MRETGEILGESQKLRPQGVGKGGDADELG